MFLDNEFYLMNKDVPIISFGIEKNSFGKRKFVLRDSYSDTRPYGFSDIEKWLEKRKAPKHRKHIEELLKKCQCLDTEGYIRFTHALSLNDTFWVKPVISTLSWEQVSLYQNEFDETVARIAFEGGLYGEKFSSLSPELGTDGSFAKCWVKEDDGIFLMKTGSSGASNAGLEPYSEVLSSQISKIICNNSVNYDCLYYKNKLTSKCSLFSTEDVGFVQIAKILPLNSDEENIFDFFVNIGAEDDFRRMLVLDALIINVDRHMGNYGVLIDNDTQKILGMAPVFDHNMALIPYAEKENFENLQKYLSEKPTRFGEDFNEVAHKMLNSKIIEDLKNLRGFQFDQSSCLDFPTWRIQELNKLVNSQIDGILHEKRLYIPPVPAKKDTAEKEKTGELLGKELVKCGLVNEYILNLEEEKVELILYPSLDKCEEVHVDIDSGDSWVERDGLFIDQKELALHYEGLKIKYLDICKKLDFMKRPIEKVNEKETEKTI